MFERKGVERIWFDEGGLGAIARALLLPAERLFGGIVGARDLLYDAGWLPTRSVALPTISVGNLTVGGTGKTPISAWIAGELTVRGARPAIVLRGYGDDEPLVHKTLNPAVTVIVDADRVAGIAEAATQGADVAVLDDAFQHRKAHRSVDLVVVSADRWTGDTRLLPAGPWREPLSALRRATLVIVTRKAASEAQAEEVHRRIAEAAPTVPRVSIHLSPGALIEVGATVERTRPLQALAGASVAAVVAIGDPGAFVAQMGALGAQVQAYVFPDHHRFSAADVARIVGDLSADCVPVCTLKDAVKLGPLWPRLAPPLWYVSQRVMVERGVGGIEHVLDDLVRARSRASQHAG